MANKLEYKVCWKRVGLNPKSKIFRTIKGAEKLFLFLDTHNKEEDVKYSETEDDFYPAIEYLFLQTREMTKWDTEMTMFYDTNIHICDTYE
jgi:hypothetical protein